MQWYSPLDPDCPKVQNIYEELEDPMTEAFGVGGDIMEDFERTHRKKCVRCQEYGAANMDVAV